MSRLPWAPGGVLFAWLIYIYAWEQSPVEEHDTSSLLQKSVTLDAGQSRRQPQFELKIFQRARGHAWIKNGVSADGGLGNLLHHMLPGHRQKGGKKQVTLRSNRVGTHGDNQTIGNVSTRTRFVNVTIQKTVEVDDDPLTDVVETRETTTKVIEIASPSSILIYHLAVFGPLFIAWSIYFCAGRPRWLYLILLAVMLGCSDQAQNFANESLVVITDSPSGLTACQAFGMMGCCGLWSALVDRDLIQEEGIKQYASWVVPISVLYAIYQVLNHILSFEASLSERAIFTNLCPVATFIVEGMVLSKALKPHTSLTLKVSLIALVVGAILYCSESLEFSGTGTSVCCIWVASKTIYKVAERNYLGSGGFLSTGLLAFIDASFLFMLSAWQLSFSDGTFLINLQQLLPNIGFSVLLLVSSATLMSNHVAGLLMLRIGSATLYLVVQGLAGFISVALGVVFYGDETFDHILPATGMVISLAAGLWYSVESYLQKMSEKEPVTGQH